VELRVCAKSGLRPGKYCADTDERRFLEAEAPDGRCSACKAPEPEPVRRHKDEENEQSRPELTKDRQPDLDEAQAEGITGTFRVTIHYTVGENGRVSGVSVTQSSKHPSIDAAVVRAAGKYRYEPAKVGGQPRAATVTRTITVTLSE
jgi:TonB family protein